jgi:hypothetical protein
MINHISHSKYGTKAEKIRRKILSLTMQLLMNQQYWTPAISCKFNRAQ